MLCALLLSSLGFHPADLVGVKEAEYVRYNGKCYEFIVVRARHYLNDQIQWARPAPVDECDEAEGSIRVVRL